MATLDADNGLKCVLRYVYDVLAIKKTYLGHGFS